MNLFFKKLLGLVMLMSFSMGVYATEVLTLQDLREEVLSENLDIKVQYEKYYQAQRNTKNNLGTFLPNLSPQLLFWSNSFGLLYAVSPNPSAWFQYRASNELALAEKYVSESIRLNILKDLTKSFVSIKHGQMMRESLIAQEPGLVAAYEDALRLEEIGVGNPTETFIKSRKLMQHRQEILLLESAIKIQKEGLMQALNRNPEEDFTLGELAIDDLDALPATVSEAIAMGVKNAPELTANTFMAEGARYMTRSAKWSFVSFSGIGFGYPSKLAIEQSRANEIALKGQQIRNKIENQIALAYEKLQIMEERIGIQNEVLIASEEELDRIVELHQGSQVPLQSVLNAQEVLHKEKRTLVTLKMEKMLQITETKRLLGLDATNSATQDLNVDSSALHIAVDSTSFGKKKVSVNVELPEEIAQKVVSVTYGGDIFNRRIQSTSGNYNLYTKLRASGDKTVTATLLLNNGQSVELQAVVKL